MNLLNVSTLDVFREFMETHEINELLEKVVTELSSSKALISMHLHEKNWMLLTRLIHRLKGSLGSVGCDALYFSLDEFESRLREIPTIPPSSSEVDFIFKLMNETRLEIEKITSRQF
jgi:HPt (histidine-containing phosphotransfer) domain-containing protein